MKVIITKLTNNSLIITMIQFFGSRFQSVSEVSGEDK